jgi:predicted secreted hydrolase
VTRTALATLATLACALAALGGGSAATHERRAVRAATTRAGFTIATAPYEFAWPRDHGSHPGYATEWWYYTGHVRARDGRTFGFELTFFRVGLKPGDPAPGAGQSRWRGHEVFPAHFAITDEAGRTFFHADRFAREALGMGRAAVGHLDVKADDWWLRGTPAGDGERERMTMHAREETADGVDAIDFVQVPEKKPAVHGRLGVSRKAGCPSCASHYYSYTRLRTSGLLTFHGVTLPVDGTSWMDHEFGSSELQADQAGWDWFSVQLDDGRELMLYRLREKDGSVTPQSSGSLVGRDGTVTYLPLAAFDVAATAVWTSPHTGAVYPSGWHVKVPGAGIDVTLAPTVLDQELAFGAGQVSYWEGAVLARDGAGKPSGFGYVELTGYAGGISL